MEKIKGVNYDKFGAIIGDLDCLIAALTIFKKYNDMAVPTHCVQGYLLLVEITKEEVEEEDKIKLKRLNFYFDKDFLAWASRWFGTC